MSRSSCNNATLAIFLTKLLAVIRKAVLDSRAHLLVSLFITPVNRNRRLIKEITMSLGLVGRKVGMTRIFAEDGATIPVTVLDMSNNRVTQIKTAETDGYSDLRFAQSQSREQSRSRSFRQALASKLVAVCTNSLWTPPSWAS